MCLVGGIGRRVGFRPSWATVGVRLSYQAPIIWPNGGMADAPDLKSGEGDFVGVQVPFWLPNGRVTQRESACLASRKSWVQIPSRPPNNMSDWLIGQAVGCNPKQRSSILLSLSNN